MTSSPAPDLSTAHRFTSVTGAGSLALWDPAGFTHIVDSDIWELELIDDEPVTEAESKRSAHSPASRACPTARPSRSRCPQATTP
ncbi:hypothetical protein [Nocardia sp. NPDC004415]